jgi:hypothetical protein
MAGPALSQPASSEEIAAMRAQIAQLMERLDRLEHGAGAPVAGAASAAPGSAASGAVAVIDSNVPGEPRVALSGDFRYRHETINDEFFPERNRQRIRARVGLDAKITDNVKVGLVLATGGDDPVSANQTLGGGLMRKTVGFDRAYFDWTAAEGLDVIGGKMANPFFRPGGHHLIFDSDLNPEGVALRASRGAWFANVGGFPIVERTSNEDSYMLGGQFGFKGSISDGGSYTVGASYFDYRNTRGQEPFYIPVGQGNSVDAGGNYLYDFNIAEVFGQVQLDVANRPLTVFADYTENTEAGDFDTGFAIGLRYGRVRGPRDWEFGYAYEEIEADAVLAAFTDSDFGGGGTDAKGHVFDVAYGIADRWTLGLKYFLNERGADAGAERDYKRLQADLSFRY